MLLAVSCLTSLFGQGTDAPRQRGNLKVGDPAPDFSLNVLSHEPSDPGVVTLSGLASKSPVVLIFGSYTCKPFRRQVDVLEGLHEKYANQAEFFVVYIREAHPSDGWQVGANRAAGVIFNQPGTIQERVNVAESCQLALIISIPMLIDDIDNTAEQAYTAWPDRLYVVDKNGRIAYKGGPGPFGFKPREMEKALIRILDAE